MTVMSTGHFLNLNQFHPHLAHLIHIQAIYILHMERQMDRVEPVNAQIGIDMQHSLKAKDPLYVGVRRRSACNKNTTQHHTNKHKNKEHAIKQTKQNKQHHTPVTWNS